MGRRLLQRITLFEPANHHLHGNHRVIDEQPECNDQGAERDSLQRNPEIFERDERHREHQRNRQGHHQPGAQTKAQEADGEHGFANLEYRLGDIEDPPIEKGTIDLAILSQALHHAPHPERAIASAHRILKKGGRLVILDLLSHRFERARELYADQWLGFSEVQLHQWLEEAGFGKLEVTVVSREKESPHFQTVFATGSK